MLFAIKTVIADFVYMCFVPHTNNVKRYRDCRQPLLCSGSKYGEEQTIIFSLSICCSAAKLAFCTCRFATFPAYCHWHFSQIFTESGLMSMPILPAETVSPTQSSSNHHLTAVT